VGLSRPIWLQLTNDNDAAKKAQSWMLLREDSDAKAPLGLLLLISSIFLLAHSGWGAV